MSTKNGVIYILTNPAFPQYVKIGYADDLDARLKQLNRSECLPFAFRAYATYEVDNRLSDIKMHNIIDKLSPDLRTIENFQGKKRVREFYAMTKEDAYALFEAIADMHGYGHRLHLASESAEEKHQSQLAEEIESEVLERKDNFSFSKCGIAIGETVEYVHDSSIKCTVAGNRTLNYNGTVVYMSGLARKLLGKNNAIQGTLHFSYNGEILSDLRARLEQEGKY